MDKKVWRTTPALKEVRWTTWERRRAAQRAADVSGIWHDGQADELRALLPSSPSEQVRNRKPYYRSVLPARSVFGKKAFSAWAPQVLTAVIRGTVLDGLPAVPLPPPPEKPACVSARPADEYEAQRVAYHSEVVERFRHVQKFQINTPLPHHVPAWEQEAAMVSAHLSSDEVLKACQINTPLPHHVPAWEQEAAMVSAHLSSDEVLKACLRSSCFRELYPILATQPSPYTLVWGDGSCTASMGIAGSGVFYAMGDPRNLAIRCPGAQSSDRSEVYAFLACIQRDPRALVFITDNQYLHDGVRVHRHRWRSRAWFSHPLQAKFRSHADLWQRIDANLRKRPAHQVVTCWARGHCRREETLLNESTDLFVFGNCAVDALSKLGAHLPHGSERAVPKFDPTVG
eukprot:gene19326-biopygen6145